MIHRSCGIRVFFLHVLQRHWHLFDILRAKSEGRRPAILSQDEVRAILRGVRTPHNHAFLSRVYACGLCLQEAQYLEVADIDSQRMMIHVHRGKGAKAEPRGQDERPVDDLGEGKGGDEPALRVAEDVVDAGAVDRLRQLADERREIARSEAAPASVEPMHQVRAPTDLRHESRGAEYIQGIAPLPTAARLLVQNS